MKKIIFSLAVVVIGWIGLFEGEVSGEEFHWEEIGGGNSDVTAVLVDPLDQEKIFMGAKRGIYFSSDSGKHWNRVLSLGAEETKTGFLAFNNDENSQVYAGTENGLFFSLDRGQNWKRIFQGRNAQEKDCTAVWADKGSIWLGTGAGLFVSSDQGGTWAKLPGKLGHSRILGIAPAKDVRGPDYILCGEGFFRKKDGSWYREKVFGAFIDENDPTEEDFSETPEEKLDPQVRSIAFVPGDPDMVYLAIGLGIIQSQDSGKTWKRLSDRGLSKKQVKTIAAGKGSRLYCATEKAIFWRDGDNWQELSSRLVPGRINAVFADSRDHLFVASERGLYRTESADSYREAKSVDTARSGSPDSFPGIAEVQQAAIRYAQVQPEKISSWRQAAARKAWLPKVSLDLDRQTSDLWHWESGSTTRECDDALRKGRDSFDWGISLSWELSDLVWSEAQTSIDVRSRLDAQLRNDVLDEVTKLYFERLKVQAELEAEGALDERKKREKRLRLAELNAYLDGLTGGYFRGNIRR